MSSKEFVDALLARGNNLDAEDAFKSAIGTKVTDKLEDKKTRTCKGFVNNHIPEPEDDKTFDEVYILPLEKDEHKKSKGIQKVKS